MIHYTSISDDQGHLLGFAHDDCGEFDLVGDLRRIESALRELGVEPVRLGSAGKLVRELVSDPPPMLWNLNSGVLGSTRTTQVAALCEMLAIPLVGSGAWTAGLVQNKTATIEFCRARIPQLRTPLGLLAADPDKLSEIASYREPFPGPYIVKPNDDESSRGLYLCHAWADVLDAVAQCLADWGPARVEKYVEGCDVHANAAVDHVGNLVPLVPLVLDHRSALYDGATKMKMAHSRIALRDISETAGAKVMRLVDELTKLLRFRQYARFDFRWTPDTDDVYLLEANYCPSLEPNDDFAAAVYAQGWTYGDLLSNILADAERRRLKNEWFSNLPLSVRRSRSPSDLAQLIRML